MSAVPSVPDEPRDPPQDQEWLEMESIRGEPLPDTATTAPTDPGE